jgi:hypothetical protein
MKKNLIIAVLALALIVSSAFNWSSPEKPQSLEGGWELVWGQYGDHVRDPGKSFQFKLFTDKHFAVIMQTEDGSWSLAGAGKYELNGDTFKETYLYNSIPDYVGGVLEWKYSFEDDKLIMSGPLKAVNGKGQEWDMVGKVREVRVRAK